MALGSPSPYNPHQTPAARRGLLGGSNVVPPPVQVEYYGDWVLQGEFGAPLDGSSSDQLKGGPPPIMGGSAGVVEKADPYKDAEGVSNEGWIISLLTSIRLAGRTPWNRIPAWAVSMVVHVVVLLVLALIPLSVELARPLILSAQFGEPEELGQSFDILDNDDSLTSNLELDVTNVTELVTTELKVELDPIPEVTTLLEVGTKPIMVGLTGRSGALKSSLLAAYGGTEETERAVAEGLAWLARQQQRDGSWSLRGPYTDGALSENRISATAMALIAFSGAGNTHRSGEYQREVDRGLKYLLSKQNSDGLFIDASPNRQMMYAQGQAMIAVCELLGMTQDRELLMEAAQRSVDFAEAAQSPPGGWRYEPKIDSDTSVTGWFVMGLMSAQMAGLSTDRRVLDRVSDFLKRVQHDSGSSYAYVESSRPSRSMTAEALLCREYLGWKRSDDRLARGIESLLLEKIPTEAGKRKNFYYWYYATQAIHHYGGQPWREWNDVMRIALPALQQRDGRERGSWPPQRDEYASAGGRLFTTCFAIYCLEVYYRHLPLYDLPMSAE